MTGAATTPPLGKILTADEITRFVARVAYPTSPVVLVDEELALAAPARAYGVRWACRTWRRRRARSCPRQPTAAPRPTRIPIPGPARSDTSARFPAAGT